MVRVSVEEVEVRTLIMVFLVETSILVLYQYLLVPSPKSAGPYVLPRSLIPLAISTGFGENQYKVRTSLVSDSFLMSFSIPGCSSLSTVRGMTRDGPQRTKLMPWLPRFCASAIPALEELLVVYFLSASFSVLQAGRQCTHIRRGRGTTASGGLVGEVPFPFVKAPLVGWTEGGVNI